MYMYMSSEGYLLRIPHVHVQALLSDPVCPSIFMERACVHVCEKVQESCPLLSTSLVLARYGTYSICKTCPSLVAAKISLLYSTHAQIHYMYTQYVITQDI